MRKRAIGHRAIAGISMAVVAFFTLSVGNAALADVDPWTDAGTVVNSALGPRSCTISATSPTLSAGTVSASGSVSCTARHDEVEITVCIQFKEPFLPESVTWQDYRCNSNQRMNATGTSTTASGPCSLGTWSYRTKVVAAGYRGGETPWTGMFIGQPVTFTCPLS